MDELRSGEQENLIREVCEWPTTEIAVKVRDVRCRMYVERLMRERAVTD